MTNIDKLLTLYQQNSKHSNYQILPKRLAKIKGLDQIDVKSRNEKIRLEYFTSVVDIKNKTILDIGGNSGYFSIEMLDAGAKSVHYYEGNSDHAEFVQLASKVLNLENKLKVTNGYFTFQDELKGEIYDIVLLLNVLHHLGDDYGDQLLSISKAKANIIVQLNSMSNITDLMIFQLGFNWKGNKNTCLFEHGTKRELIDFISNGIKDNWDIIEIGIAERVGDNVVYTPLTAVNIQRDDSLGEFLNRPVFVLKSKFRVGGS
jgi:SAM-dependent methyltransferase